MDERQRQIDLGLAATWGYAPGDLTSPVHAAAAGALADAGEVGDLGVGGRRPVTELRIHGVGGSTPERMLEHPHAVQVGGDARTMFFRRWHPDGPGRPGVPWPAEAYSWGGLTESPLASAVWIVLAPFMLLDMAYFALPGRLDEAGHRRPGEVAAAVVLRFLALTTTLELTLGATTLPFGVPAAVAAVAVLCSASVLTAHRYEARVHRAHEERTPDDARAGRMTRPGFWRGEPVVRRQRWVHTAAALALVALVAVPPGAGILPEVVVPVGIAVLALAVLVLVVPGWTDHWQHVVRTSHDLITRPPSTGPSRRGPGWLLGGAAVILGGLVVLGIGVGADVEVPPSAGPWWVLLVAQGVLCAALVLLVWGTPAQRRASASDDTTTPANASTSENTPPFAAGHLASVLGVLTVGLGGWLTLLVVTAVRRALDPFADALPLPLPLAGLGLVPAGMVVGLVVPALRSACRWGIAVQSFGASTRPGDAPTVQRHYPEAAPTAQAPDDPWHRGRSRVARAWATGLLVDDAGWWATGAAIGGAAGLVAGEVAAAGGRDLPSDEWLAPVTTALGGLTLLGTSALVWLLRKDLSSARSRKSVGAIWDVATFWPRAVHPFAPPCYAERAVPELVDRVRLLTGTVPTRPGDTAGVQMSAHEVAASPATPGLRVPIGRVLLTGYSQGAVIAPAVVAQLPTTTQAEVSLLTLASPLRRLYGRAFPAYLGHPDRKEIAGRLTSRGGEPRWKNLVRLSDYIGSWVDAEPLLPGPGFGRTTVTAAIDQLSWDPPTISADIDQAPPPVHRHSAFWNDARVLHLGIALRNRTAPVDPADPIRGVPS